MPRVAVAGVFHESNTFVPGRTGVEAFRQAWHEGPALVEALDATQTVVGGFLAGARRQGLEPAPALHAWATPAGPVEARAFETVRDALVRALRAQGPVDGLLLELHGAMVAEGVAAADTVLARSAREAVGDVPVVAVLDPHANISPGLVGAVDALLTYRTNPHVDMAARGEEAVELMVRMLAGERVAQVAVRIPVTAPAIAQATAEEPLATLVNQTEDTVRVGGAAHASLAFGFAYADVPELGMTAIVGHRNAAEAAELAVSLAQRAWDEREAFRRELTSPADAIALAARIAGPVALADTGDNVGGGAPGDSTVLAAAALAHGGLRAVTTVCDPRAVERAAAAGAGSEVELVVGSPPLRVAGTVRAIRDGRYVNRGPLSAGVEFDMGRVAVVDAGALAVVLQSRAVMANDQNMLRGVGVAPEEHDVVILKGAAAVRAGWRDCVERIVDVATPGPTTSDLGTLGYASAPRPLWPLDEFAWEPD